MYTSEKKHRNQPEVFLILSKNEITQQIPHYIIFKYIFLN